VALDAKDFTEAELQVLLDNVDALSDAEVAEVYTLVEDLENRKRLQTLRDDLIAFCRHMQDDYKVGAHHRRLASLLEDIEQGRKDRICVSVPPRHGKSQLVSIYYAAWYLGRNPTHKVMLVSHTTDLAVDFGRKVRNLIATERYREVFPTVTLSSDSKSAGRWSTSDGGEFFAAGVGSALAGRGAHLLLVDDPHSEQDILNGNFGVFEKAYEWFTYGARTRLMPGGKVAIIHCMTGDTPVLMADGAERSLRDIRPGDMVASYDGSGLVPRKVLNWANQGADCIYTIKTTSSRLIRANARHPFLVQTPEGQKWVKVSDLKTGDSLVSLPAAGGQAKQRHARASANHVSLENTTTGKTPGGRAADSGIGGSGRESPVAMRAVALRPIPRNSARNTTTSSGGQKGIAGAAPTRTAMPTSNTGTASALPTTIGCWWSKMASALSAVARRVQITRRPTGRASWRSTTATTPAGYARSCAIPATLSLDTGPPKKYCLAPLSTLKLTLDTIESIEATGEEDVFDIQVEDTENFIANGVVSHNTRWHMDDLIGRLVRDMTNNAGADQYEVFEFPAILEKEEEVPDLDPEAAPGATITRIVQRALWPEFFDLPALLRTKASMPVYQWNSQYQQSPTAEEAAVVKREWWRRWLRDQPPPCEYIMMSLDAAAETHNRADYTALTVWGVFEHEDEGVHHLILLHAIKDRYEFPELKTMVLEQYKEWAPDAFIVEKKSAGVAIYQELRRMGLPVQEYTPHRGTGDKMARLNSVADILASGMVWAPERRWAEEVIEEIAAFPFGSNDDLVDSTVMALLRFRQGGFLTLPSDEIEDSYNGFRPPVTEGYY
jgi:predicted phage terminase large subunit-like protein